MNVRFSRYFLLWPLVFFGTQVFSFNLENEKENIIRDISYTFNNFYAPTSWKKAHYAWDIQSEISKLEYFLGPTSLGQFQKGLKDFFISARDYHTNIFFADTGVSYVPFDLCYVDGKFLVSNVSPSFGNFPLKAGDEVVEFNGQTTKELALNLIGNIDSPSLTDWALGARKITRRLGVMGDAPQKGPVNIVAKRGEENLFAQTVWNYEENELKLESQSTIEDDLEVEDDLSDDAIAALKSLAAYNQRLNYLWKESVSPSLSLSQKTKDPTALGKRDSYLPKLSDKIIWHTDKTNPWEAYIYLNENKKLIGFIRIGRYVPEKAYGGYNTYVEEFGKILQAMDAVTDALVIDQLNNPGGSVLYLYSLMSVLAKEIMSTPLHRFTIDSKDVWEAHVSLKEVNELIETLTTSGKNRLGVLQGYPVDLQFLLHVKSYFQFIIQQWDEGKSLTDPYYLYGVNYIYPHPNYHYSKPVLFLINELDFSGGDFAPAILQDANRVTLMGRTTAGAGGYVLAKALRNKVGVLGYSYTASLAFRQNNDTLENLGVTPDIQYPLKAEDLATGFLIFKNSINEIVENLLLDEMIF